MPSVPPHPCPSSGAASSCQLWLSTHRWWWSGADDGWSRECPTLRPPASDRQGWTTAAGGAARRNAWISRPPARRWKSRGTTRTAHAESRWGREAFQEDTAQEPPPFSLHCHTVTEKRTGDIDTEHRTEMRWGRVKTIKRVKGHLSGQRNGCSYFYRELTTKIEHVLHCYLRSPSHHLSRQKCLFHCGITVL